MDPAPPPDDEAEGEPEPEEPGFFSTLDPRAQRWMVIVGVVALVVGLLGGFAAGFKVEQNRVKSSAKNAKKATKVKKITRVAGAVTDSAGDSFTVADAQGLHVKILLPSSVVVEKTAKGAPSDIKVDSDVLLRGKKVSNGVVSATEIIALPATSKFGGLTVKKVDGNKLTVESATGPLTINVTPNTLIYKTSAAKPTDVKKNSEVLIRGSGLQGGDSFTGADVIVLPPGSGFASAA